VSAPTGAGLDQLRAGLDRLLARLPPPDPDAPVRLWIDRSFSVRGSGTVVTGTLPAGRLRVGDELEVASSGRTTRVRALQALGHPVSEVAAVARVAVNLRGVASGELHRGDALLGPQRFRATDVVDVRVHGDAVSSLPPNVMLHVGSAAVPTRVRPFGDDTARLSLARALPLRIGDRGLVRDPGRHHVAGGVTVLDVAPPALTRRGAAATRAQVLEKLTGHPDERDELRRRGLARRDELERMGVAVTVPPVAGDWVVDEQLWATLRSRLPHLVADWGREHPLEPGAPVEVLRRALDLPERCIVSALVTPPLVVREGRVGRPDDHAALPAAVATAVERLRGDSRRTRSPHRIPPA